MLGKKLKIIALLFFLSYKNLIESTR